MFFLWEIAVPQVNVQFKHKETCTYSPQVTHKYIARVMQSKIDAAVSKNKRPYKEQPHMLEVWPQDPEQKYCYCHGSRSMARNKAKRTPVLHCPYKTCNFRSINRPQPLDSIFYKISCLVSKRDQYRDH